MKFERRGGLIVDSDVDDWKRTVDVWLIGPMLTNKHTGASARS